MKPTEGSRHILDMFGSHASLSDSHPSSFIILPPSIPPLHLSHRTFLNRCRPLLHDDLHGDIWAQLGTCPDIARITNNPPELPRKIQVSNPTHGLLRPFTKCGPASMLCHSELYCVMGSCIISSDGTRCAGLRHSKPEGRPCVRNRTTF